MRWHAPARRRTQASHVRRRYRAAVESHRASSPVDAENSTSGKPAFRRSALSMNSNGSCSRGHDIVAADTRVRCRHVRDSRAARAASSAAGSCPVAASGQLAMRAGADAEIVAEPPVVEVVRTFASRIARRPRLRIARVQLRRGAPDRLPACPRRCRRRAAAADSRRMPCSVPGSVDSATNAAFAAKALFPHRTARRASVCCGSAYIRSRLRLPIPASCACLTARSACAASWMRPMRLSASSSKLCTPKLMRLTPARR